MLCFVLIKNVLLTFYVYGSVLGTKHHTVEPLEEKRGRHFQKLLLCVLLFVCLLPFVFVC